jgi:ubiquinone/menaquinone biosynthesis C-methylase UbiE
LLVVLPPAYASSPEGAVEYKPAGEGKNAGPLGLENMDPDLRRKMLHYYNERAPEYEEAFTCGTGTSSMADSAIFKTEAIALSDIVRRFAKGRLVDLACGTAYWLPNYAARCSHITLFDQSEKMLEEARKKVRALEIVDHCSIIQGDFFEYSFALNSHECALVGFFLSHLTESQEQEFFNKLRQMLTPNGQFLILDSAWSPERAKFNAKVEHQGRLLNDGTHFDIYKKYFDQEDILSWPQRYQVTICVEYFQSAFCAVSGTFTSQ